MKYMLLPFRNSLTMLTLFPYELHTYELVYHSTRYSWYIYTLVYTHVHTHSYIHKHIQLYTDMCAQEQYTMDLKIVMVWVLTIFSLHLTSLFPLENPPPFHVCAWLFLVKTEWKQKNEVMRQIASFCWLSCPPPHTHISPIPLSLQSQTKDNPWDFFFSQTSFT